MDDLFGGELTLATIKIHHAIANAMAASTTVALDPETLAELLIQLSAAVVADLDGPAVQHILTIARALKEVPRG